MIKQRVVEDKGDGLVQVFEAYEQDIIGPEASREYCAHVEWRAYWFITLWKYKVCQQWDYDGTNVTSFKKASDSWYTRLGVTLKEHSTETERVSSTEIKGTGKASFEGTVAGYPVRSWFVTIWIKGFGNGTWDSGYSVE